MSTKKRRERQFLDIVLSADPIAAPSEIIERERPDFVIKYPSETIGVEITQLYRRPTSRGSRLWEGACESVLEAATRWWEWRQLPPVHVSVTFDKDTPFPKSSWAFWGEFLGTLVHDIVPEPGGQSVPGPGPEWLVADVELPVEIKMVMVSHTGSSCSNWTLGTGGAVHPLDISAVQDAIDAKEPLIDVYRIAAPVTWLIIAFDRFRYSSDFGITDSPALDATYTTSMDRIFLVPRGDSEFYELDRRPPDAV